MKIQGHWSTGEVYINGTPLSPQASQGVVNHSPDGFAWGYGGSGPAQLALALLLYFYDRETACRWYQDFKWDVIAGLPQSDWEMDSRMVMDWMSKRGENE